MKHTDDSQGDLFMRGIARAVTAQAVAQAAQHAQPDWMECAAKVILEVARRLAQFTADDVWATLDQLPVRTHERSALWPVFRYLMQRGLIVPTGETVNSARPSRHSAPIRVWRLA